VSSTLGVLFRVTTFGESHGPGLGVVVDGCPPRLSLSLEAIQAELDRRRPGQSRLVTQRKEADQVEILSGVLEGVTLGTPIAMLIRNQDARSKDYEEVARAYRPSHADYTYDAKYGVRAIAGGGRASARETAARVAAGAIAQQLLAQRGVAIVAWTDEVSGIAAEVDDAIATTSGARTTRRPRG
jgi:chorismate synthase